jgi:hypothetical protein
MVMCVMLVHLYLSCVGVGICVSGFVISNGWRCGCTLNVAIERTRQLVRITGKSSQQEPTLLRDLEARYLDLHGCWLLLWSQQVYK